MLCDFIRMNVKQVGLPEEIKGLSFIGKEQRGEYLTKLDIKVKDINSHGVYKGASGQWYVKKTLRDMDFKEVMAANCFRYLVNYTATSETRLLITDDHQYYVMSKFTNLERLSSQYIPGNLVKILIFSYIIGDKDTHLGNIMQHEQEAFRIDFGNAFKLTEEENKRIPLSISFDDLDIRFPIDFFSKNLEDSSIFYNIEMLNENKVKNFPWDEWDDLSDGCDINLSELRQLIEQRMNILSGHMLGGESSAFALEDKINKQFNFDRIAEFYALLIAEKQLQSVLVFPNSNPLVLAKRHILYQTEYGQPPRIFLRRVYKTFYYFGRRNLKRSALNKLPGLYELEEFILKNICV